MQKGRRVSLPWVTLHTTLFQTLDMNIDINHKEIQKISIGPFYFLKDIYEAIRRICVSLFYTQCQKQCTSSHQHNAHMVPTTVTESLAFGTDSGLPKESQTLFNCLLAASTPLGVQVWIYSRQFSFHMKRFSVCTHPQLNKRKN